MFVAFMQFLGKPLRQACRTELNKVNNNTDAALLLPASFQIVP